MDAAQVEPGRMTPYGALPRPAAMVPFTLTPRRRHSDLDIIAPASAAAETITMPAHTGTHIDALCHIGEHQDALGNPQPGEGCVCTRAKGKR